MSFLIIFLIYLTRGQQLYKETIVQTGDGSSTDCEMDGFHANGHLWQIDECIYHVCQAGDVLAMDFCSIDIDLDLGIVDIAVPKENSEESERYGTVVSQTSGCEWDEALNASGDCIKCSGVIESPLVGDSCTCGLYAEFEPYSTLCVCVSGYHTQGNFCVEDKITTASTPVTTAPCQPPNIVTSTGHCIRCEGVRKDELGDICECKENAYLQYMSVNEEAYMCSCDDGYTRNYFTNTCDLTTTTTVAPTPSHGNI